MLIVFYAINACASAPFDFCFFSSRHLSVWISVSFQALKIFGIDKSEQSSNSVFECFATFFGCVDAVQQRAKTMGTASPTKNLVASRTSRQRFLLALARGARFASLESIVRIDRHKTRHPSNPFVLRVSDRALYIREHFLSARSI